MQDLLPARQAQRPLFFGIDVGGTNTKFGLVDDLGRTVRRTSIPTEQEKGPQDAVGRMCRMMDQMVADAGLDQDEVAAIGLATPGTMDLKSGMTLQPHNLPDWWNFPIRDRLHQASGRRVAFSNDANAAAFGEYWVGRGAEFGSIAFFTLGTGIGGGIIVNGVSVDGEHSHGSECGHTLIDYHPDARICGCGQPGHLEAYACAGAVIRRTEEQLATGRPSSLKQRVAAGEGLTPLLVAEEAGKDDKLALEIVMQTACYLAIGAVNVMHTVDPGAVIFGGAMTFGGRESQLGQRFMQRIRHEVRCRCFPTLAGRTVIDFATLGGDAGYIGAAGIARQMHQGHRDG